MLPGSVHDEEERGDDYGGGDYDDDDGSFLRVRSLGLGPCLV